jgi:hypothetical protein
LRQSTLWSPSSENQSTDRQSFLITENSKHVLITKNLEHPDESSVESSDESLDEPSDKSSFEPSVKPLVESSDGLSVNQSFKSPRPSAPLISVNQSRGRSIKQPMGRSMRRSTSKPMGQLMSQLMRRSMNQPISDIHVRCGIEWMKSTLLNETRQWLLNNRANHLFKVVSVSNQRFYQSEVTWPNRVNVGHVTHTSTYRSHRR